VTGSELFAPFLVYLLASACAIADQIEESLSHLTEALQIIGRTGERWLEPELKRLQGALLLRQGNAAGAEQLFREALTVATEQRAKFWELRAAVSLARLCRDLGRVAEARDVLAPIPGWFTEGFESDDLIEAKVLLDELTAAQ
jgi:predicted ATPase